MSHWKLVYQQQILSDILQDDYAVEAWTKIFELTYSGHINTWDYQWTLSCWLQNSLSIHPRCNLVTNIGGGIDATHTNASPYLNLLCETMRFPLHHPPFIFRDTKADAYIQRTIFDASRIQVLKNTLKKVLLKIFPKYALSTQHHR